MLSVLYRRALNISVAIFLILLIATPIASSGVQTGPGSSRNVLSITNHELQEKKPTIYVTKNPALLSIKNPDPEEVREKIAKKYNIRAGPVFSTPANWTFAVYLDGDNNLNSYAEGDFNEMGSVGSDESIGLRIVVLIDKYERGITPDGVGLWYIEPGDTWNDDYSWADEYWGEQNMGDPNTLIRFLEDVLYNYSAYHYVVVLWDHGGGISGVCWDDTDGDHLTIQEVRYAFEYIYEQYGVVFDIVAADACLMGDYFWEMTLFPYAKIAVHSQESESGEGYAYDYILSNITNKLKSGIVPTPEYFADCIAFETMRANDEAGYTDQTQSAVNLTKAFYELGPALSAFADALLRNYDTYASEIDTARTNADTYAPDYGYDYLRDLYGFAENIYNLISDPEIRSLAQQVMNAVEDCVIANYVEPDHANSHGISVYFPSSTNGWDSNYDQSYVDHRNFWGEFARKYEGSPYAAYFYDIWLADAIDDDGNGYYEYIKLGWDIDEDSGSGLSIYVKLWALSLAGRELRNIDDYENSTDEFEIGTSGTYTVTGRASDVYEMEFYNFVPSQGEYAIRANIYDSSGVLKYVLHYYTQNISSDLWKIPLEPDTLAPRLSFDDPANGTIFNTTTFNVTITIDEAYLSQAVLYLNGSTVNTYTTEGTYTETVTVSQDGVYNLTLYAVDNAGNENRVTIFVTVDTTAPTVTITSPSGGSYINSTTVTIYWSGSDSLSGIDHYNIYVDGSIYAQNIPAGTTSYDLTLNEGTHTIRVVAYDKAGNSNYDEISITIDVTAPSLSILSPANDSTITSSTVTVEWSGSDNFGIDHYEVKLDSGSWIDVGLSTNHTFSDLSSGSHTVYVRAVDLAGNINVSCVVFTISLGSVEIESPTEETSDNKSFVGSDTVILSWSATGSVDHYEIYVNGTLQATTTSNNYEISGLGEGIWNITVVAAYTDGSTVSDYEFVVIDLTPPDVQPSKTCLLADSTTTNIVISWNANDSLSGIDHYEVFIAGSWTNVGNSTNYTIDTSSTADGIYAVYIRAFDKAGHWSQDVVVLIVDKVGPSITVNTPDNNSVQGSSSIFVSWDATDNLFGVDHYEVSLDGSNWIDVGRSTSYVFSGLGDGQYTIWIRAYDLSKNYNIVKIIVTVDTTAPDVQITSPQDGETITDTTVTVYWSSTATDIEYYLVRLDDGPWINVGLSTSYTFTGLTDGAHVVYVMAVDNAGNTNSTEVVFIIQSATGSTTSVLSSETTDTARRTPSASNIEEETAYTRSTQREAIKKIVLKKAVGELASSKVAELNARNMDNIYCVFLCAILVAIWIIRRRNIYHRIATR